MRADTTSGDRAAHTADEAQRRLVGARLGLFTASWLAMMLTWVVVLTLGSTAAFGPALLTMLVHLLMLGVLWRVSRGTPGATRPQETAFATCIVIGVSSIALFAWVEAPGELLSFTLFTLCLVAGLVFAWGWRFELAMFAVMLIPFGLARSRLDFSVSSLELDAAIVIGTAVAVAIAEGSARSFRLAFDRQRDADGAMRTLATSRDAFRDITESARDSIWEADREGIVVYINEAGARILGYAPAALIGTNIDHLVTDHPRNPSLAAIRAMPVAEELRQPMLMQWTTPNGPQWFEMITNVIMGDDGEVLGFRGISRDVTKRVEAEDRLRESEARYRGIIASQEALIFRCDLDGDLRFLNEAGQRKYGVENARIESLNYLHFVHPDDAPHALAALRSIEAGTRFLRQSRGRTAEGWRWIEWEVSAITDESGAVGELQGVGRDVTEQRAADEALQRSLGELRQHEEQLRLMALRQVAIREEERKRLGFDLHDGVCQELVGINILIESARQQMSAGPGRVGLGRAQTYLTQVGEHLRKLARDIRPLQLPDLGLADSLRALATGISDDAIGVDVSFPTGIPRLGEDTEVAVYRIAQEALMNAVRHADAKTITLTLAVREGVLSLEVRDDGCGFDYTRKRSESLGLITMEERATGLGGTLQTISTLGEGTSLRLECPITVANPQSAA